VGGRDRVDPELARVVEQRLEDLLAERGPPRSGHDAEPGVDRGAVDVGAPARRTVDRAARAEDDVEELDVGSGKPRRDLAETGRRRPSFTRVHLVVVAALATLGVLLAGWAVLRARPIPLPAVAAPRATPVASTSPVPESSATPSTGPASARASPAGLVVHVLGAVRRQGLVRLPERARVQDAIDQAGGLRPGADLGDLNLAQLLTDGQQVVIGRAQSKGGSATGSAERSEVRSGSSTGASSGAGGGASPPQLDLNAATVGELEALPGVGPVTAAKIIAWREEHGRFTRVEELQEVAGIGPKTYADIAPYCRV
jgi:competence protein ComEA